MSHEELWALVERAYELISEVYAEHARGALIRIELKRWLEECERLTGEDDEREAP